MRFSIALTTMLLITLSSGLTAPGDAKPAAKKKPAAPAQANRPANDAAWNGYAARLQSKLLNKWLLPDGKNHVVLTANVGADGSVTELNMTSAPNNAAAEQAATDAFNGSQPLECLPAGSESAKLTLTFDSFASQHDANRNVGVKIDPVMKKPAATSPEANAK